MTQETFGADAARRQRVQVGPTALSYLEWGEQGPVVLLLHGITSNARVWWRAAQTLQDQGYHVYAFDMPGHGESDATDDHRLENIAGLIAGAAEQIGLSDVALIGHSWGGATALTFAASGAGRLLRSALLVDPAMVMAPWWGEQSLPNYTAGVGDPPEVTRPAIRAANPDWHPGDVFWKGEALAQCRESAVRGFFTQSGEWNLTPLLSEVHVPLLLLVADPQNTVIPAEVLAEAEATLRPGLGQMRVIPGTTHNMLRGASYDATLPVIVEWLRQAR